MQGCIRLVHKDNTNMGMTLDFVREVFGLLDWAFRCFIHVLNYIIQASKPVLFWVLASVFSSIRFSYIIQSDI
jgi:hypothetical protein